jgi:5'-3' exoribonuclease 1
LKKEKVQIVGKVENFEIIHISLLREYLELEFDEITENFKFDIERVIDDFILICFLCGNDFLPNSPSLDISNTFL